MRMTDEELEYWRGQIEIRKAGQAYVAERCPEIVEWVDKIFAHAGEEANYLSGWDTIIECVEKGEMIVEVVEYLSTGRIAEWTYEAVFADVAKTVEIRHDYASEIRATAF